MPNLEPLLKRLRSIAAQGDWKPLTQLTDEIAAALARPMNYNDVEDIENLLIRSWVKILASPHTASWEARLAFTRFFTQLGFLFKYKVYGAKIALPFGYSIFQLHPGEGFSFQLHLDPKLEAFNILAASPNSGAYLADVRTWIEYDSSVVRTSFAQGVAQEPLDQQVFWRPTPGDTMDISNTETVHSVFGCDLEEYASCSVDSVDRLYDQNIRNPRSLPDSHPKVSNILTQGPDLPSRRVWRSDRTWRTSDLVRSRPIIDSPTTRGGRLDLSQQSFRIPGRSKWVTSIVPVAESLEVLVGSEMFHLDTAQPLVVAPFTEVTIVQPSGVVAVHQVDFKTAAFPWAR